MAPCPLVPVGSDRRGPMRAPAIDMVEEASMMMKSPRVAIRAAAPMQWPKVQAICGITLEVAIASFRGWAKPSLM